MECADIRIYICMKFLNAKTSLLITFGFNICNVNKLTHAFISEEVGRDIPFLNIPSFDQYISA